MSGLIGVGFEFVCLFYVSFAQWSWPNSFMIDDGKLKPSHTQKINSIF